MQCSAIFFTHDTPNFNNGSCGHTAKFRLMQMGYTQYVATKMRIIYANP
jgi:hypothetical protein